MWDYVGLSMWHAKHSYRPTGIDYEPYTLWAIHPQAKTSYNRLAQSSQYRLLVQTLYHRLPSINQMVVHRFCFSINSALIWAHILLKFIPHFPLNILPHFLGPHFLQPPFLYRYTFHHTRTPIAGVHIVGFVKARGNLMKLAATETLVGNAIDSAVISMIRIRLQVNRRLEQAGIGWNRCCILGDISNRGGIGSISNIGSIIT